MRAESFLYCFPCSSARARKEFPNTLLLDNGATIQGTALADYQAQVDPLKCGQTLAVSQVPGIDAMLIGHSHQIFPNSASTVAQFNLPGVDQAAGRVTGLPTTLANLWGKHLGMIGLLLTYDDGFGSRV
jgi:2',3'-cyclic-nucleotide 2'-phosphodiesterase (5'-nucleotidase family)